MRYDFLIVGGGIVGLSTAWAMQQRFPDKHIALLEKEAAWAFHQTGHNSGVIHSGIYYKPGSLKARLAREGNRQMVAFCEEHGIRHEVCGKVIVAADEQELPLLKRLYHQGLQNELELTRLTPDELHEIEPHVSGLAAIKVHSVGIVRYAEVAEKLAALLAADGATLSLSTKVLAISQKPHELAVETTKGTFLARHLINCAGLHSDRIARMNGEHPDVKIIPFRGEYYLLKPEKQHLVKHLIYPVPNPQFPFLGVHFTRMIDGHVDVGPNAVLSLKREGYRKMDFDWNDFLETIRYPAFWKLAATHWRNGLREMYQSFHKGAFVRAAQRLIPEIQEADLIPAPAGVRAQALQSNGSLVDDFYIIPRQNSIHVCNAPSPAATASLMIGEEIAGYAAAQFQLD
ncbi:L-2-hydroxyglutarate oxidase [Brevibacillus sp. NRS-1366]|uniref:L-2-hydroxyglutarate oxidase n=1 Tax=Brevibacillus sp. NRS-1366 TaxID=3233899 RepID=UPI003D21DB9E